MPVSSGKRDELKKLYNALADRVLEPGDKVYIEELNAHGASGANPVEEIATEIDWQEGGGVCLFTGQRGTGKSTELKKLQQRLEQLGIVAFYADLSEYVLLTKPLEISDFLISICGAMSDRIASDKRFGQDVAHLNYWQRLKDFLQTKVEFTDINAKLGLVEIKAALKNDPGFKQAVQRAARGYVTQLVANAHKFLSDAVEHVRRNSDNPVTKVSLIVDSIERVRGVGEEAMTVYESVRNLFFTHAEHLRVPLLHVVYTVPPYLSILAAGAGTLMGGATVRRLVSTHIFKNRSRSPDPVGMAIMRKIVRARYPELDAMFNPEAVDRLAESSGGDLREFFRLLRQCLPAVQDDAQLPLTVNGVAHAENAARNEMLPIPANQLAWLKHIAETHETCLKQDGDLPVLAHFLDNRLVLNYRNGSDWYDVHPLLRAVVDKYAGTPATT